VPAARQVCTGSLRLVEVKVRPKNDKVACPDCTINDLVGTYTPQHPHLYELTPSHIGVGQRMKERHRMDWSDVAPDWEEVRGDD